MPIDFSNSVGAKPISHIQQQRTGAAGEIEDALQMILLAAGGILAIEGHDGGEDAGNLLRRVELARLLAGTCGELADQILVSVSQRISVGGKLLQPVCDFADDRTQLGVAFGVVPAELIRVEGDLGEQTAKRAVKGLVLDVFEALLQFVQQIRVLRSRHLRDTAPKVRRLNHVVHFSAHRCF